MYFSVQISISNQALLLLSNDVQVISSAFHMQFSKPASFEGQFIHQNFFVCIYHILLQKRKVSVFLSDRGYNLVIKTILHTMSHTI